MQSTVSEHVNVLSVLNQVLNTKVELAVGEGIGMSRKLSGQLANAIKFKPGKQLDTVGLTTLDRGFWTKTHGLLMMNVMEILSKKSSTLVPNSILSVNKSASIR